MYFGALLCWKSRICCRDPLIFDLFEVPGSVEPETDLLDGLHRPDLSFSEDIRLALFQF